MGVALPHPLKTPTKHFFTPWRTLLMHTNLIEKIMKKYQIVSRSKITKILFPKNGRGLATPP